MNRLINNLLFHLAKDQWKGAIKERDKLNLYVEKQKQKMIKYTNRKSE